MPVIYFYKNWIRQREILRALMKHDKEPNRCPGQVPEYGAIFMSSISTKKECFKRQLLGLPMGQANFVKQVKEGMILFLFEYEKRKLHGVFRASSDGQINIVPRAFSSSGKQFPAQVKFTVIWDCRPLSEDEFRDSIRNNYFTQKKFYFGLSEKQVRELLLLFSSRKLNNEPFQRQSTQNIRRPIHYSDSKPKSDFDGFFEPMNGDKDRHDDGHDFRSFTFTRSPQDSIHSSRRLLGDNLGSASLGKTDIADGHFGNPVGTFGRLTHCCPCATSGEISNEHGDATEPRLTNVRNYDFMESRKADIRKYDVIEPRLDGQRNYDAIETKLASDTRNYDVIEPRFAAGTRNYVLIEPRIDGDSRTYDVTEPIAASTRNVDLIEPRLTVDAQNYAVIEARLAADKRNYDVIEARLGDISNYCGQSESMFTKELINVRNYSEQSKSLSIKGEVAEDVKFTMRYGTRTGVEKSAIESDSPLRYTKCTLVNDQLQQLAKVHHSVEPHSSNQNFLKTYENAPVTSALVKPRISSQFCPTTHDSAPVISALPYEPSVPHINCGHSLTPGPYNPKDESPLENRVAPSFDNPFDNLSLPSQLGQINMTRYCSAPISFETYPEQSYKTSMPSSGPVSLGIVSRKSANDEGLGHFSTSSNSLSSVSLPHYEDMQSLNEAVSSYSFSSEASPSNLHYCKYPPSLQDQSDLRLFGGKQRETYAINDPRFKASQSIGVGVHENASGGPNANDITKTISAESQKRKSVFSRISFPAQAHKKDNCVHNKIHEHRTNLSVDEVMALLHQSRTEWEIAGRSAFLMEMYDDDESSYQKGQVALNSKLSKVQRTTISQDVDLSGTLTNKEKDVQITESVPFLDFKRRGKVRKNADNANAGDCLAGCNKALNVQQKRRKLIRPNFDKNELSADQMQYNQNVEAPNSTCPNDCGAKRNDARGSSNCIIEEKVESSVETFRDGDADENCKETVRTSCLQSENPVDLVGECHRFSQHCESTVEPVRKNCSKRYEEKAEIEITCCGDEIGGFDENFVEGVGIVKKTCESKEVSPEPEPEKQSNPSLSLESLPGQYKISVENVSHCSAEESSQGICEVTDRNAGSSTANVGQELSDDCGAKRNDARGSSNCIIEEKLESSVETSRDGDADEHCKETERTLCLQSENPVDLVAECHRFSQHCESTVEPVRKNCSKKHEEKAETEITCCGDEIGGFDENFVEGVGIVKKTCESKEVSPEPEPGKQSNPSLPLESLPGQYKISVENVSHCSAEESSQGICEVTDRNVGLSTANVGQELSDDCGAKRNDARGSSNCIIEEKVESSVETFRDGDADEHCKETVRTLCLQSENPVDLVAECHRLSQHCESTVEPVRKNCSKKHEEKAETEITCCGDEIGGDENFVEGVGIVKKTCERTVLSTLTGLILNSVDHNSESKEVSPEPEPEKQSNPSLSLESLPGQYKISVENVSHCSAEESSQGICEVTDRNVGLSTANVGQELSDEF